MTENIGTPEIKSPADIDEFKTLVGKADGTIVPLARQTAQGTELFIASRYVANPLLEDSPDAEEYFYGWQEERKGVGAFTGVMVVDVYTKEDGEMLPIGHMDWWLQGDYANGGGNMHGALVPRSEAEQKAQEMWGVPFSNGEKIAFKIQPEYQKQQIGSLMVATSSVVLANNGVSSFYTGVLLDPAVATYERFGIHKDDFPKVRHTQDPKWWRTSLPIDRLADNGRVDQVIQNFIEKPAQT